MKERLIISVAVGYMLKVLKSRITISDHKPAFDAIRHGDYIKFIKIIEGPMPYFVSWNEGIITSGYLAPQDDDINFALLLKTGPSIIQFHKECFSSYGEVGDHDITDEIFEQLATFEINLRMHASNNKLTKVGDRLSDVIDQLGKFKNLNPEDIHKIQSGRKFLNMIKHNGKHFKSFSDGLSAFLAAELILEKNNLTAI